MPPKVPKLLIDFSYVLVVDLPNELPPMHNVQYAVVDLLSLPTSHMNPLKHVELKRQVDKLLLKGFIRESLSTCAMLALLAYS